MPLTPTPALLRNALGRFATGITVVTTVDPNGQPVGLTVNSFNSLSLEPALVLWSLGANSPLSEAFLGGNGHFAVNILRADQQPVSDHFASRSEDKFSSVAWHPGVAGVPVLDGCLASFECRRYAVHPGGDHHLLIGEVLQLEANEGVPLLFFGGRYTNLSA